jgi:hypothetical protein
MLLLADLLVTASTSLLVTSLLVTASTALRDFAADSSLTGVRSLARRVPLVGVSARTRFGLALEAAGGCLLRIGRLLSGSSWL